MVFKPADIKQNPLFPKPSEQPKPKQEIIKQEVQDKKKEEKT